MKAISIKQPWASLIVHGIKPIENRTWKCPEKYIGQRVLIHASKTPHFKINLTDEQMKAAFELIAKKSCVESWDFGAIIGSVVIKECVVNHPSIWAEKSELGQDEWTGEWLKPIYNWVLESPTLYEEPIPAKGNLSFWEYEEIKEVKIECPECGMIQPALIDRSKFWDSFVHECRNCSYMITESDWEEVE